MKTIKLLYFARLREALGVHEELVQVEDKVCDISQLAAWLRQRGENWEKELGGSSVVRVAVNLDMAQPNTLVHDQDEVAFFPPVTGG